MRNPIPAFLRHGGERCCEEVSEAMSREGAKALKEVFIPLCHPALFLIHSSSLFAFQQATAFPAGNQANFRSSHKNAQHTINAIRKYNLLTGTCWVDCMAASYGSARWWA